MAARRLSRRLVSRFLLALGVVTLLCLVGAGIVLYRAAAKMAHDSLHQARKAPDRTPVDAGIPAYREVSFVTSDGLTIRGWLIPGSNGALIILGHGNQGNRADMLVDAVTLARAGYGILMFDWRGQGYSDGDTVSFGQFEVRDLRAAVDFASQIQGVRPDRIGAEGFSMGASTVTLEAAQDERLRAVIIEDTFAALEDVVLYQTQQVPLLGPLAIQAGRWNEGVDASAVRPVDAICKISPRPVLLIYGAGDTYLPPGSADQMFAAACQPKELWKVPDAGHGGFQIVAPDEYAARIVAFFDQNLLK